MSPKHKSSKQVHEPQQPMTSFFNFMGSHERSESELEEKDLDLNPPTNYEMNGFMRSALDEQLNQIINVNNSEELFDDFMV